MPAPGGKGAKGEDMNNEIYQARGRIKQEEHGLLGGIRTLFTCRSYQSAFKHPDSNPYASEREEVRILTQKGGELYLKAIEVRQYHNDHAGYEVLNRTEVIPPQPV